LELPLGVNKWALDHIVGLVTEPYLETEKFEFKRQLYSQEPDYNDKLTTTACAFANAGGGFIIFGVKDLGEADGVDRIEGIPLSDDLANDFGQKIARAAPTIHFEPGNPPIRLTNGKVVFIVQIPMSATRPHMTGHELFYIRTNTGNTHMTYEQVRDAFAGYQERTYKAQYLFLSFRLFTQTLDS